jgi:hypothetical protein
VTAASRSKESEDKKSSKQTSLASLFFQISFWHIQGKFHQNFEKSGRNIFVDKYRSVTIETIMKKVKEEELCWDI